MTFLAHRGLARFILSSQQPQAEFTDVVEEHFGHKFGLMISVLYFLSIFPHFDDLWRRLNQYC